MHDYPIYRFVLLYILLGDDPLYQVLYRKWRPKTFSDVVGQPQVTTTLKNELKAGRIAHAYLFTGSRGTGKTSCAKILSKAINCIDLQNGDPCGKCEICKGIDNGSILDIVEIDAASNNGVENIRNLREEASFTPASAKYRVYIIDEVHMLSIGAFNALLKTLEEPPEHVIFILATTEVHKLPATILSRCQRFDFHRIAPNDIAIRLKFVAENEGYSIDHDAALMIAYISDGALRDALSLLDQCLGKSSNITSEIVSQTAGLTGHDHIINLSNAILEKNSAKTLDIIDELYNSSKNMIRLSEELVDHFRTLMLIKTLKNPKKLVLVSEHEYKEIEKQAKNISIEFIIHILDCLQSATERMIKGSNKRVEIELALIKLTSPELDYSNEAIINRISKLEKDMKTKVFHSTSNIDSKSSTDQNNFNNKKNNAFKNENISATSKSVDLEELQKNAKPLKEWPEILNALKSYSKAIATAFSGSTAYVSGNFVLIDSPNSMAFELLRKSAQRDKMRIAIQEITGQVYKLGPYRKPTESEPEKNNLDELINLAKDAGIEVTQN